jgi:hypothetical protein
LDDVDQLSPRDHQIYFIQELTLKRVLYDQFESGAAECDLFHLSVTQLYEDTMTYAENTQVFGQQKAFNDLKF